MGQEVRNRLKEGAKELARAVAVTYGPQGKVVLLDRKAGLLATRDGVAVAVEVSPQDPLARLGAHILRRACVSVNEAVGEGTSTTAILAEAIYAAGHRWVTAGEDPWSLVRDIRTCADIALSALPIITEPVVDQETLRDIALHTTKGDVEVANALAQVAFEAGAHGMITIDEGKGVGIEIEHKEGLELETFWESEELSSTPHWSEDRVLVACIAGHLTEFDQIAPVLQAAAGFGLPLLLVSDGVHGPALHTMTLNVRKGGLKFMAVRCPGGAPWARGILKDVAALSGATIFDPSAFDWQRFEPAHLGSVQQASVTSTRTTLFAFEDKFQGITERVAALHLEVAKTVSDHERDVLRERIARLTEGFYVLRVGGVSEVARKERRGLVEDALHAVRGTFEQGVVPGGGLAYLALAEAVKEVLPMSPGVRVLVDALEAPLRCLASNSGEDPLVVLNLLKTSQGPLWEGWDPKVKALRDFRQAPLIADPAVVVRTVIETAVSVASTLLLAEVALTQ